MAETAQRCAAVRGMAETAFWKEPDNSVRQFFGEMESEFVWDLLPFDFIYELYKSWVRQRNPNGVIRGRNGFIREIVAVAKDSQMWSCNDHHTQIRANGRITRPEPLILRYNLRKWMSPGYRNGDAIQAAMPVRRNVYRGLLRRADAPRPSGHAR